MEERLRGERNAQPPEFIEVAQKSNSETVRYNKIYNHCIRSSKWSPRFVHRFPIRRRELSFRRNFINRGDSPNPN